MAKRILVPLLDGFEEIEAVTIIDVLRRADLDVTTASDKAGPVTGAHGIAVSADAELAAVDAADLAMIVLPGGMPGAANLAAHPTVQGLVRQLAASGRLTAAICAAPMALASAGVLDGRRATCYPGFESKLTGATLVEDRVVVDGTVVTSRGPATAMDFGLALVGLLLGPERATALAGDLLAA